MSLFFSRLPPSIPTDAFPFRLLDLLWHCVISSAVKRTSFVQYFHIIYQLRSHNWTHAQDKLRLLQHLNSLPGCSSSQQTSLCAANASFFCCYDSLCLSRKWEFLWFYEMDLSWQKLSARSRRRVYIHWGYACMHVCTLCTLWLIWSVCMYYKRLFPCLYSWKACWRAEPL